MLCPHAELTHVPCHFFVQVRVTRVRKYNSFEEMIEDVGIDSLLPGFDGDLETAVQIYKEFGTTRGKYADLEKKHGAVAIDVEPIDDIFEDCSPLSGHKRQRGSTPPSLTPSPVY